MRVLLLVWSCCLFSLFALAQDPVQEPEVSTPSETAPAQTMSQDSDPLSIYVPDGQLKQHPFRVFVPNQILAVGMDPKLCLSTGHNLEGETFKEFKPVFVSSRQQMAITSHDVETQVEGTLLLFDLSTYPMGRLNAMVRFTPSLSWNAAGQGKISVVNEDSIYFGNLHTAAAMALIFIILMVLLTTFLSRKTPAGTYAVVRDDNGRLSLSKTQMAMWTIAIGGVTAVFGLIHLEVPQIPSTLLVLMAMSLTTSSITNMSSKPKTVTKLSQFKLSDLISESVNGQESVSLARTQMVFWTVLNVGLFVVKSILDGVLWEVPAEMVGLMGMSQASYLVPKIMPSTTATASPDQGPTQPANPNPAPTNPPADPNAPNP